MDEGYRAPAQAFYDMSKDWYRDRTDEGWEPLNAGEAMELWARHGFSGPFWSLD